MRKDRVRTERNRARKEGIKTLVRLMRRSPSVENLSKAASALDKAAKTHFIHKNKASRLKSRLSKLLSK